MRAKLEEDLTAQIDTVRLQANTARAAQVAALEAEAAERLEATRRDAEAALGILATELETQAAKRLETTRRDADTSLAAREAELEAQAVGQVASAVREAQAEAAQMIIETLRQHDAVLAKVRAEAQADVTQAEARVAELKQELADRLELQAAARDDALRGAAAAAQQHDAALAAVRVQLEASEARRVKLDQDFAVRIDTLRREADIARSTQVAAVDKEATERLEATRRDAESALAILAKELEAQADGRVEAARHNADTALAAAVGEAQAEAEQLLAETTQQHDVAVETVQAEAQADLSRAEHRVAELQRELAERVEADAAARDAALRTAAETARQHDGELAAVRAELEAAEARQVKLEQDFAVRVDTLRREADTARATQVAALETQAAQRLAAAVHDAESEAAQTLVETVRQHDATLAVAGAQLEDAEARRIEREQDFLVRVDTLRREADIARAAQVSAVQVQAAERVETAVRASEEEAAQKLAETRKQHDIALASVRAEAQADATRAESRLAELKQELADRIVGEEDARAEMWRVTAEMAQQYDTALTAARAQLKDAEARRAKLEEDLTVRVETARREADTAQATQVAEVEAQANERVEAAVRASQAEAAQQFGETRKRHDVALANVRAEAQADVTRYEDRLAKLKQEFADRVETAETAEQHDTALAALEAQLEEVEARRVKLEEDLDTLRREADTAYAAQVAAAKSRAAEQVEIAVRISQDEATQKLADMQKRHDVALASVRAEAQASVSRAEDRLAEVQDTLTATRKQVDLTRAEMVRLQADRLNQRQPVKPEARGPQERQLGKFAVTRRGMADITGAVVLAGFAGTLLGLYVAFAGLF